METSGQGGSLRKESVNATEDSQSVPITDIPRKHGKALGVLKISRLIRNLNLVAAFCQLHPFMDWRIIKGDIVLIFMTHISIDNHVKLLSCSLHRIHNAILRGRYLHTCIVVKLAEE